MFFRRPIARALVVGGAIGMAENRAHEAEEEGYERAQREQAMQQQAYNQGVAASGGAVAAPLRQQQVVYAQPPAPRQVAAAPVAPAPVPVAAAAAAAPPVVADYGHDHEQHYVTMDYCNVLVTQPSLDKAKELASTLVQQRLASAVSVIPHSTSVYSWRGEVRMDDECVLFCKTRVSLCDELTHCVVGHEGRGEVPEVTALPILGGNPEFFRFIKDGTKEPNPPAAGHASA